MSTEKHPQNPVQLSHDSVEEAVLKYVQAAGLDPSEGLKAESSEQRSNGKNLGSDSGGDGDNNNSSNHANNSNQGSIEDMSWYLRHEDEMGPFHPGLDSKAESTNGNTTGNGDNGGNNDSSNNSNGKSVVMNNVQDSESVVMAAVAAAYASEKKSSRKRKHKEVDLDVQDGEGSSKKRERSHKSRNHSRSNNDDDNSGDRGDDSTSKSSGKHKSHKKKKKHSKSKKEKKAKRSSEDADNDHNQDQDQGQEYDRDHDREQNDKDNLQLAAVDPELSSLHSPDIGQDKLIHKAIIDTNTITQHPDFRQFMNAEAGGRDESQADLLIDGESSNNNNNTTTTNNNDDTNSNDNNDNAGEPAPSHKKKKKKKKDSLSSESGKKKSKKSSKKSKEKKAKDSSSSRQKSDDSEGTHDNINNGLDDESTAMTVPTATTGIATTSETPGTITSATATATATEETKGTVNETAADINTDMVLETPEDDLDLHKVYSELPREYSDALSKDILLPDGAKPSEPGSTTSSSSNDTQLLENAASRASELINTTTRRSGKVFDAVEEAALDQFIEQYRRIKNFTRQQTCERIWANGRRRDDFWVNICKVLPYRTRSSIYKHVRRRYHIFEQRGKWTPEEDLQLAKLCIEKEGQWSEVGKALGRMPEDCRDRWRNYIKCGTNRASNKWSVEEEELLRKIINEMLEEAEKLEEKKKKGLLDESDLEKQKKEIRGPKGRKIDGPLGFKDIINWTVVSERMGGARSRIQCRYKWNKLVKKQALAKLQNITEDEKRWILEKLRDLGFTEDSQVDWDELAKMEPGSKWTGLELKLCYERMRGTIRGTKDKNISEISQKLLELLDKGVPIK